MQKLVDQKHPALHEIAAEVPHEKIGSPKIRKVIKDMRAALHAYDAEGFTGVAIAAPQIGIPLRIFIVEDMGEKKETDTEARLPDLVAINPRIVKTSKQKKIVGEGCLSVPDQYGAVERAVRATLRAYDEQGNEYERGASGLLAQVFQHECDHLDGILFVDRAEKVWNKSDMEKHRETEAPRAA